MNQETKKPTVLDVLSKAASILINNFNLVDFKVIPNAPQLVTLVLADETRLVTGHQKEVEIVDGKITIKAAPENNLEQEEDFVLELFMDRPMTQEDLSNV